MGWAATLELAIGFKVNSVLRLSLATARVSGAFRAVVPILAALVRCGASTCALGRGQRARGAFVRWKAKFMPWRRRPLGVLSFRAQLIDNSDPRVRPWAELRLLALLSIWAPELPNQAGKSVDICTTGTVERPERPRWTGV